MKRISLSDSCALFIITSSALVMTGWIWRIPSLIEMISIHTLMVFNTALCFFISGSALLLINCFNRYHRQIAVSAGLAIMTIAVLTLLQTALGLNLSIDELFAQAFIVDSNPFPGRMANNTNVAFILTAAVFLAIPFLENKLIATLAQAAMFIVAVIGFVGLLGYVISIEYLYSWYGYRQMATITATCFLLVGIGLIAWWKDTDYFANYYTRREDKKILFISLIVLFCMALLSGLLGFVVSANQSHNVLSESMQQLLQDKAGWLKDSLQQIYTEIDEITGDDDIRKLVLNNQDLQYNKLDDLIINTSFSSIKIYNASNKMIFSSGKWTLSPDTIIILNDKKFESWLFVKNNNLVLQASIPISVGRNHSGIIMLEWDIKGMGLTYADQGTKQSESYIICGLSTFENFTCTPSVSGSGESLLHLTENGINELKRMIISKHAGMFAGTDRLNESVMVSYRPLDYLNIGIVLKKNLDMVYYPMKKNLMLILPFLFLVMLSAAFILYRQVLPIVKEMLKAKNRAHNMNTRLNAIFNNMDEGIIVTNEHGLIEDINPKAAEIFGIKRHEAVTSDIQKFIPDVKNLTNLIGKGAIELKAIHANRRQIPIEFTMTEMNVGGKKSYISLISDISEKKLYEAKLKESEEKFRSAFDSTAIGMAIVAKDGRFMQVNEAVCKILGYTESELLKSDFQSIIISQDLADAEAKRRALLEKKLDSFVAEERYHHKNGNTIWLQLTYSVIHPGDNQPLYFVVQIQNISEQKKSEEELAYQAYYDALTGLANRMQLEHHVESLITSSKRYHDKFAVFFLDLDKFKMINDIQGHQMGDEVLMIVSERLLNCVRKSDMVARLGGDEFVIIVTAVTTDLALAQLAKKIIQSISETITVNEHQFKISTSLGISLYPADGNDYASLIKKADKALYMAKENGRNQFQFYGREFVYSN